MFRSSDKAESSVTVDLEEPLTAQTCAEIVIEIIKYVMYQKQQIPFSGDTITKLYANTKPTDRNYSSMNAFLKTFENISYHLTDELNLDECDIKEIVIAIGATIISPKLCIKLELPNILNSTHIKREHPHKKHLMNVMRSILQCTEFEQELSVPLLPTNTFVLVQKRDPNKIAEFFIPKPQFKIASKRTTCLNIRFNFNENGISTCNCKNYSAKVPVFHDKCSDLTIREYKTRNHSDEHRMKKARNCESDVPYQWYQSKEVFKGFKFIK